MLRKSQTPVKRISAIILLLLFSYNAVFAHVSLWLWKAYMNEQIEELAKTLPNELLEQITLPDTETIEHEIAFNGVMYDVIRCEKTGTVVHYFCIKDFTENLLSSTQEEGLTAKRISAKQQWAGHAKQLQKNISSTFLRTYDLQLLSPTPDVHVYAIFSFSPLACLSAVPTPPPNLQLI